MSEADPSTSETARSVAESLYSAGLKVIRELSGRHPSPQMGNNGYSLYPGPDRDTFVAAIVEEEKLIITVKLPSDEVSGAANCEQLEVSLGQKPAIVHTAWETNHDQGVRSEEVVTKDPMTAAAKGHKTIGKVIAFATL